MGRAGLRKVDQIVAPNGTTLVIRLDMGGGGLGTGTFIIELPDGDDDIKGKDLSQVKREAEKWLEANRGLTWQPIIVVDYDSSDSFFHSDDGVKHDINFCYSRYFTADRKAMTKEADNRVKWRKFQPIRPEEDEHHEIEEVDLLEGKPGGETWSREQSFGDEDRSIHIPYTHEAWKALRELTKLLTELDKKLGSFVHSTRIHGFLASVLERGRLALLEKNEEVKS